MSAPRVMTPARGAEARRMAAQGMTVPEVAKAMGILEDTLRHWARRSQVTFQPAPRCDGLRIWRERDPEAFRAAGLRGAARAAEVTRLSLTKDERRSYHRILEKARRWGLTVTRADALRAIGRADLTREAAE